MEKVALDTNILIEVLKGNTTIVQKLEKEDFHYCISAITAMELYYGAFNKAELMQIKKFISLFELIELDQDISSLATDLVFHYAKSHNLTIPDSLIAASAISRNIKLYTLNLKDFQYIDGLVLLS